METQMSESTTQISVLEVLKSVQRDLKPRANVTLIVAEPPVAMPAAAPQATTPTTGYVNFTAHAWAPAKGKVKDSGTKYVGPNKVEVDMFKLVCDAFTYGYSSQFGRMMRKTYGCFVKDGTDLFRLITKWAVGLDIWRFRKLLSQSQVSGTYFAEATRKLQKLSRARIVDDAFVKFMLPGATPSVALGDKAIDEFKAQGYTPVPLEQSGAALEAAYQEHIADGVKLSPQKRAWITRRAKMAALIGRQSGKTATTQPLDLGPTAGSFLQAGRAVGKSTHLAFTAVGSPPAVPEKAYAINETNIARVFEEYKLAHPLLNAGQTTLFLGEERLTDAFRKQIKTDGQRVKSIGVHVVFVPGAVGGLFMPNYDVKKDARLNA
jgi:hypothetical protein